MHCNKKDAVTVVTYIDRSGSCVVACGGLTHVQETRDQINKISAANLHPFKMKVNTVEHCD